MEEILETEQEFYDNTQLLLQKIDLDIEKTEELFNKVVEAIGDHHLYEVYLIMKCISIFIEDAIEIDDKDKAWFEFTADRCMKLKKEEESICSCGGIH